MPEVWVLLGVGLCLLAAAAFDVAYVAMWSHGSPSAKAVEAQYPLPEVTGVLRLRDPIYSVKSVATVGGPCKGMGSHDGFLGGTPVVVRDQAGAVVATGALDIGKVAPSSTCEFGFVVQGVPTADRYQFDVGGRDAGDYRYDDIAGRGWQVALSLR
jgi:hypothetical protein